MSRYTKDEAMLVVKTMVEQLVQSAAGINRLRIMTGAKNFGYSENENEELFITFKIGRNAKSVNHVRITLTNDDLYTVEYLYVTMKAIKERAKSVGIYNDMLKADFETNTGMYLSL